MASGDTLIIFHPYNNEPPASAYATLDTRNAHVVLDFDDSTDESAVFSAIMPQNYAGTTGVTVYVHWAATTATSGDVIWAGQWERVNTDMDSDSFATAVTASAGTANGTSGIITTTSFAFTDGAQMDSVAVGEVFRFKLYRDADNGSDTMTGDAEVRAVEIRET